MKLRLTPLFEPRNETLTLDKPSCVVGRSDDCDLRIKNASISRRHCEFIIDGDHAFVRDLQSCNGTFVNHRRVYDEHPINDGDVVAFFNSIYRVEFVPDETNRLARLLRMFQSRKREYSQTTKDS